MRGPRLDELATLVFDCDGVILDSNKVKTEAFFTAALPYGEEAATRLVEHHVQHGGVSRYKKFEHFLRNIVGAPADAAALTSLLERYAGEVRSGLLSCAVTAGLEALRAATSRARWLVVSGGDQDELRGVLAERGLTRLFDGGIFGSPATKDEILTREISAGNVVTPAVFLGDSRYDFEVAASHRLEFVFVSGWSEFSAWRELQASQGFAEVPCVAALLDPARFATAAPCPER